MTLAGSVPDRAKGLYLERPGIIRLPMHVFARVQPYLGFGHS
jgi:hypothetical protein